MKPDAKAVRDKPTYCRLCLRRVYPRKVEVSAWLDGEGKKQTTRVWVMFNENGGKHECP